MRRGDANEMGTGRKHAMCDTVDGLRSRCRSALSKGYILLRLIYINCFQDFLAEIKKCIHPLCHLISNLSNSIISRILYFEI